MHLRLGSRPSLLVTLAVALLLSACTMAIPVPTASPEADDFAVVRAIAEASYREGVQLLEQGQLEEALVALNRAFVNDPDQRADIRAALDEAIERIRALPPPPTRTAVPTRAPVAVPQLPPVVDASPAPSENVVPPGFETWNDDQGRFRLARPTNWLTTAEPPVEFGSGIIAFIDPTAQAEFVVAVDTETQTVSPELYAARMELAMQNVSGYALESVFPGVTAGNPSMRRNFVLQQRDASGRALNARGFQITVLRGNTPYILGASAPATAFAQFAPVFEQIVSTFQFR